MKVFAIDEPDAWDEEEHCCVWFVYAYDPDGKPCWGSANLAPDECQARNGGWSLRRTARAIAEVWEIPVDPGIHWVSGE